MTAVTCTAPLTVLLVPPSPSVTYTCSVRVDSTGTSDVFSYVTFFNVAVTAAASALALKVTTSGVAPLTVQFSSAGTLDPDGDPFTYAWDFDRNGTTDWGVFQLNDGGTLQAALRRIGTSFTSTAEAQQHALAADPATVRHLNRVGTGQWHTFPTPPVLRFRQYRSALLPAACAAPGDPYQYLLG